MINFILNNETISTDLPPGTPLLDFIRKEKVLKGTKEGCREGDCGACLVLIGELEKKGISYHPVNSCIYPLGEVVGKHIITIEGVNSKELNLVQQTFVDEGAIQCGFCTPGFILSLISYFLNAVEIREKDAISSVDGNICRCTGYISVVRAIKRLCKELRIYIPDEKSPEKKLSRLKLFVSLGILPEYFLKIPACLSTLSSTQKAGSKVRAKSPIIFAGGTDVYIQKNDEFPSENLVFLSHKKHLKKIWRKNGSIFIGSMTTVEDIKNSPVFQKIFPEIEKYFKLISSTPIRHRATVGGNIVTASPIGDLTIFFLALNAVVVLNNGKRKRELLLKDFFKGYKLLDKKKNDVLECIRFEILPQNAFFNFEKVSRRKYLDIASVNSAINVQIKNGVIKNAHISAGGVAPVPLYLSKVREFMVGKEINNEVVKETARIAQSEISPISDVRGSKEYKRLLLRQLIYSHFIELFPTEINIKELI